MALEIQERESRANGIINKATGRQALSSVGNPIPYLNAPAIVTVWMEMLIELAFCYNIQFDEAAFQTIMRQIQLPKTVYSFGYAPMLTILLFSFAGLIPMQLTSAAVTAAYTFALGHVFKNAWSTGREPSHEEIALALKQAKPVPLAVYR